MSVLGRDGFEGDECRCRGRGDGLVGVAIGVEAWRFRTQLGEVDAGDGGR